MLWLWRFIFYSFIGFLLEITFARLIRHPKRDRKCFILLPLCPVYGLGAVLILWLTQLLRVGLPGIALIGFLSATAAEYLMGSIYEKVLHVQFWDYSNMPLNVDGKVCLLFSLCWTGLAVGLICWFAPLADALLSRIPAALAPPALILLVCDGAVSCIALRRARTTNILRWYR